MMNATQNPFTPMLLTFDPEYFYGRANEIISILQVLTAPEPGSHAIYGIRTIGKTTLLRYLKDEHGALYDYEDYVRAAYRPGGPNRLCFVYLSFNDFEPGDGIFKPMLRQLKADVLEHIELNGSVHIDDCGEGMTREQVIKLLRKALHDLHERHFRVVFLLDDFDAPLEIIEDADDHLLRSLSDEAALIIATEAPISELRPDLGASSPLLGILRPESIGLLSADAARQMIMETLQAVGISFTEAEVRFLMQTAGRQPFLLLAACELYFEMHSQYPDIATMLENPKDCETMQKQFIVRLMSRPHVKDVLNRLWLRLGDSEQQTLHEMVLRQGVGLLDSRANIAAHLENKALAYWDIRSNGYRIFSALFGNFVMQQFAQTRRNGHSHSILDILDELTPLDQSLARYLYDHANQVCTFDELLDAIWHDSDKSKRALEAAVHRIRQRLGTWEEIKNIRGKGYTFVTKETVSQS